MERNANYALVGVLSTLLLIGLIVFVVLLAGNRFSRRFDEYNIVFQGPVRGLSQGAEVHFNGIKVGDVSRLYIDPDNSQQVIVRAKVTTDVPIRTDSLATLEPLGITGVNYVQISAGTRAAALRKTIVAPDGFPRMASRRDALSDLLAGGGFVVQRSVEALDRVNRLLSDENINSMTTTLGNLQSITAELNRKKAVIEDAQKTLQSADQAAQEIRDLAKSSRGVVDGDAKKTIVRLGEAASDIDGAAKDLRVVLKNLNAPTADFAANGGPQISSAVADLQRTTNQLDRLLGEVQANPQGLITKPKPKDIQVKP
jgi:phospholipid/cholesterol/gamma-HCH transport system substrate-binding protein